MIKEDVNYTEEEYIKTIAFFFDISEEQARVIYLIETGQVESDVDREKTEAKEIEE